MIYDLSSIIYHLWSIYDLSSMIYKFKLLRQRDLIRLALAKRRAYFHLLFEIFLTSLRLNKG